MRVADYLVNFFVNKGIRHVFLLPGGGAMHLVDAFHLNKKIEIIPLMHEQSAVIAAESYGRISNNKVGLCCVTTGPGSTNAITGVMGSWIESLPLIILSGQVKTNDLINDKKIRQSGVQEVNITPIVKNFTKYSKTLTKVNSLNQELTHAFNTATSGRKGPVWLDIPLDIQGAPINTFKQIPLKKELKSSNRIKQTTVKRLKLELQKSSCPIIFSGHGVRLSNSHKLLIKFIKRNNIPISTSWNSADILPYKHHLNAGRPGVVAQRFANILIQRSDLILCFGSSLDNILTAFNPEYFGRNAKIILIDVDFHQLKNAKVKSFMKIEASFDTLLSELNKTNFKLNKKYKNWLKEIKNLKKKFINDLPSIKSDHKVGHYEIVRELSKYIPSNRVITTGSSGLAIEAFYTAFVNKINQRFFLTSGLGAMGYGLPSSIGACIANKKKKTYLIESDGSFCMSMQELIIIDSFKLPICIILMNNKGYASIRSTQRNYFNSRYVGTGIEAGIKIPDFKKIARSFNLNYRIIKKTSELNKRIKEFEKKQNPIIIDIQLTKNENLAPKVSAMPQNDGSIVSMPFEDMSPLLSLDELNILMKGKLDSKSILIRKKS